MDNELVHIGIQAEAITIWAQDVLAALEAGLDERSRPVRMALELLVDERQPGSIRHLGLIAGKVRETL